METVSPVPGYTQAQRLIALLYGVVCHTVFAVSITVMFVSLYQGLAFGLLHLHGWAALLMNGALVAQFAVSHSLMLTDGGRRFLARLAPFGLGRDLSTTTFALIASMQLLATFALWSPSHVLWSAPVGWVKGVLTLLYIGSWVLLWKSMRDAGIDVQTGSLGWLSVWRGRRPDYKPFARSGLFRHTRQPIYVAFALILWTAPVWTPDHLVVAVLWTLYCVVAPRVKEKRYLRFYGQAFARYQMRVPYWMPQIRQRIEMEPQTDAETDCEVAIVGGGPVGLLLANLLGARGRRVMVFEKRSEVPAHSQAIGITPPSLDILASLGLDAELVRRGVRIEEVFVHGESGHLGVCSFRGIPGRHRFVLSIPQSITVKILEENLVKFPSVTLRRGVEVTDVAQEKGRAFVVMAETRASARYVVACDGGRSPVRGMLKVRTHAKTYPCHFVMGDFTDHSALAQEAHLFFTADGAVESFPLPGGLRRWIVQTREAMPETEPGFISRIVQQRTGMGLPVEDQRNQTWFTPRRLDCEVWHDGRIVLCGDAAHLMSPIGGQGMNVGFGDAEHLVAALSLVLEGGTSPEAALAAYGRHRRKATRAAANHAAAGMWLGTWRGEIHSLIRDCLMKDVLFSQPFSARLGPHFAMLELPRHRAASPVSPRR